MLAGVRASVDSWWGEEPRRSGSGNENNAKNEGQNVPCAGCGGLSTVVGRESGGAFGLELKTMSWARTRVAAAAMQVQDRRRIMYSILVVLWIEIW